MSVDSDKLSRKLIQKKEEIRKLQQKADKLVGEKESLEKELKAGGIESVEEAEDRAEKLFEQAEKKLEQAEKELLTIDETLLKAAGEDDDES